MQPLQHAHVDALQQCKAIERKKKSGAADNLAGSHLEPGGDVEVLLHVGPKHLLDRALPLLLTRAFHFSLPLLEVTV